MDRDTAWHVTQPAACDGAQNAEARLLVEQLRHHIANLPPKLREVLQLSVVEDMEAADVSAVLGIPPGTVRSRLHTARKLLLEVMQ